MLFSDPLVFFIAMIIVFKNILPTYTFSSLIGAILGVFIGAVITIIVTDAIWPNRDQPIIFFIFLSLCMGLCASKMSTYLASMVIDEQIKNAKAQKQEAEAEMQKLVNNQSQNDFADTASFANTSYNSGGEFEFNSSRFNDKRTEDKYTKWQNTVSDPDAPIKERNASLKRLISADKGEISGIKALEFKG